MKPFLHGKKNLAIASLRPLSGPPGTSIGATAPAQPVPGDEAGAHVEVVKEGDKIVRIIVTCACGERVEVDCLYQAGA